MLTQIAVNQKTVRIADYADCADYTDFCVFVIRVRSVVKYALGNLGEKSIDFSSLSVMRFKRLL